MIAPRAFVLLAVAALPVALPAQAPEPREAITAFWDSIGRIDTAAPLRAAMDSARGEDALALVRRSLLATRLAWHEREAAWAVTARGLAGQAEALEPTWAWPRHAHGLALLAQRATGSGVTDAVVSLFGPDARERSLRAMRDAAASMPPFLDGLLDLVAAAERTGDPDDGILARDALRAVAGRPVATLAPLRIARSHLERLHGDRDSAQALAEAVLADGPSVAASHALALARFAAGRDDGAGPWYDAVRDADPGMQARLREDLRLVVPDSVLATLAAAPEARVAALRAWFDGLDRRGLPLGDDYLKEAVRRLDFARRFYRRSAPGPTVYDDPRYDDRGVVFLRHGSPTVRTALGGTTDGPDVDVTLRIVGMPVNESWRYERDGEPDLFFHFLAAPKGTAFRAVGSIFDILAASGQARLVGYQAAVAADTAGTVDTWGAGLLATVAQELLRSRMSMDPIYKTMLDRGKRAADSLQGLERELSSRAVDAPPRWDIPVELALPGSAAAIATRDAAGAGSVHLAFALAGEGLAPRRDGAAALYPVRIVLAVTRDDGRVMLRLDTTRVFRAARPVAPGAHLLGRQSVALPPGRYTIAAMLDATGARLAMPPRTIEVPAASSAPSLTPLVLGRRDVPITVPLGADGVAWLEPFGHAPRRATLVLTTWLEGLAPGTAYRATLRIRDASEGAVASCGDGTARLSLGADGRHPGGRQLLQRELALGRLRPGRYQLELEVRPATGDPIRQCAPLEVRR
ncbi:MAG TPA: hypothetical protein VFN90_10495 [Gemmatimonadales bacterium]|nr:hypothetical protein [Gemmatimonadales bacterium]